MTNDQTVLAIIPARGGSRGVPRKNVKEAGGKPLIAWTIETAKSCTSLDRVIVSTDDDEIRDIVLECGAELPFQQPAELAESNVGDFPVMSYALTWLRENEQYEPDIVVWLRPTAPLRTVEDIEGALQLFHETGADTVRSVCLTEHHPYWMKTLDDDKKLEPFVEGIYEKDYNQRQKLPPVYRLNGAVDVINVQTALSSEDMYGGSVRGYKMDPERSIDLDTPIDFAMLDLLLSQS